MTTTTTTAIGYQLGTERVALPHLGTFATADDALDVADVLTITKGRNYALHVVLEDGTTAPVAA